VRHLEGDFMPNCNEPSCWRAAMLTFAVVAGLMLVAAMVGGGDATAIAAR
jgi:hypothetical protein